MPDPSEGAGESRRYQLLPRRRFARRRLVQVLLVLALLGAVHRWWGDRAEARFERGVAALAAAGEPVSLAAMAPTAVSEELNGTLDLRLAAGRAESEGGEFIPAWLDPPAGPPLTAGERERYGALIASHADVFDAVRAARLKGGVDWHIPVRSPEWMDQTYRLEGLGDVATLLGHAALYEHDRGNHALALDHVRSLLFLGRSLTVRPFLFSQQSGNTIGSAAARRMAEIAPDLYVAGGAGGGAARGAVGADDVRAAIAELLDDGPWRDGLRSAFRGERARLVQSARAVARGDATLAQLQPPFGSAADGGPAGRALEPAFHAMFRHLLRPRIYDDGSMMARHLGVVIERFDASADWPTAWRRIPRAAPGLDGDGCGVTHTTAAVLLRTYSWDAKDYYESAAERRLAAAALAARWYAAEHGGALPARLEDLVPAYLPSVPLDPLAEGGKVLGYVADDGRPVVYSVGDDGQDDGGREYREEAPLLERLKTDNVKHLKRQPRRVLEWRTVEPPPPAGRG